MVHALSRTGIEKSQSSRAPRADLEPPMGPAVEALASSPLAMGEVPESLFHTPPRAFASRAGADGDADFTFTPPQSMTPPAEEVFSHGVWSRSQSGISHGDPER